MKQKNEESKNKFKKGFTLIELLVVVLIIGLLAAIALPQYKLAVEKSRSSEPLFLLNSLQKAINLYLLQNGYTGNTVELMGAIDENNPITGILDIDVESVLTCDQDGGDKCRSKDFEYDAWCSKDGNCYARARRKQNGEYSNPEQYRLYMRISTSDYIWEKGCFPNAAYPYTQKLCKGLQGQGWGYDEFQ